MSNQLFDNLSNISDIPNKELNKKFSDTSEINDNDTQIIMRCESFPSLYTRNSYDNKNMNESKMNDTSKLDESEAKLLDNEVHLFDVNNLTNESIKDEQNKTSNE